MKIPNGWILKLRANKKGTEVFADEQELVYCKDCMYFATDNCKWRKDETPDDDDFCSIGERG